MSVRLRGRGLSDLPFPLWVMFLDTFVMALGFYMLVPLLAFHLVDDLGLSVALAGLVNGVRSAGQQGLMLWSGVMADRIGYRNAICLGVTIRAAGFLMLGLVESPGGLVVAAAITGLGGSLFHPASYAAYGALTSAESRVTVYSIRELFSNVGFVVGPAVGGLLARVDFTLTCLVAASLFLLAGLLSWAGLRDLRSSVEGAPEQSAKRRTARSTVRDAFVNRDFLAFTVLAAAGWVLVSQLYLAVPFQASRVLSDPLALGTVYSVAAAVMVFAMIPTVRTVDRHLRPAHAMALATALLTLGLSVVGVGTVATLYLGVMMMSFGQAIFLPIMNGNVSKQSPPGLAASYFGVNGLALAVGGLFGSIAGGFLLGLSPGWVAWAAFGLWGAGTAALFARRAPSG